MDDRCTRGVARHLQCDMAGHPRGTRARAPHAHNMCLWCTQPTSLPARQYGRVGAGWEASAPADPAKPAGAAHAGTSRNGRCGGRGGRAGLNPVPVGRAACVVGWVVAYRRNCRYSNATLPSSGPRTASHAHTADVRPTLPQRDGACFASTYGGHRVQQGENRPSSVWSHRSHKKMGVKVHGGASAPTGGPALTGATYSHPKCHSQNPVYIYFLWAVCARASATHGEMVWREMAACAFHAFKTRHHHQ
jgi:hypothetical protein